MARAESASASAHSNSIKGLAQAVARPAYRRLITAEPFLRRAVPVLIVAFLLTLGIAAFVDVRERLRQAIAKSAEELDLIATVMAERVDRLAASETGEPAMRGFRAFERIKWPPATSAGRLVLLTDTTSTIIATQPPLNGYIGRKLNEAVGRDPQMPAVAHHARRVRGHARPTDRASCSRCATSTRRSASSPSRSAARSCSPNGAPTPRSPSRCSPRPASSC